MPNHNNAPHQWVNIRIIAPAQLITSFHKPKSSSRKIVIRPVSFADRRRIHFRGRYQLMQNAFVG
jgi:hypothetical protein